MSRFVDINRAKAAELVPQLMWGPKTLPELAEATGLTINGVQGWMLALQAAGVVHVIGERRIPNQPGRPCPISAPASAHEAP